MYVSEVDLIFFFLQTLVNYKFTIDFVQFITESHKGSQKGCVGR
jgi:hypothetical protein